MKRNEIIAKIVNCRTRDTIKTRVLVSDWHKRKVRPFTWVDTRVDSYCLHNNEMVHPIKYFSLLKKEFSSLSDEELYFELAVEESKTKKIKYC